MFPVKPGCSVFNSIDVGNEIYLLNYKVDSGVNMKTWQ